MYPLDDDNSMSAYDLSYEMRPNMYNGLFALGNTTDPAAAPQYLVNAGYGLVPSYSGHEDFQIHRTLFEAPQGIHYFEDASSPDSYTGLTPLTPQSSVGPTSGETSQGYQANTLQTLPRRIVPRYRIGAEEESLQGLVRSRSRISRPFSVHPDVLGPLLGSLGRSPQHLNPSQGHEEPWSGVHFRSEGGHVAARHKEPTGSDLTITFENPRAERARLAIRPAMRDGPLPDEKRQKINEVRKSKACIRCKLYREPCDAQLPCRKCRKVEKHQRKWRIKCTHLSIKDRFEYLEHTRVNDQHGPYTYNDLITQNSYGFDYSQQPTFDLELWLGDLSGGEANALIIEVIETQTFGPRLKSNYSFRNHSFVEGVNIYERDTLNSPSVVPIFRSNEHKRHVMERVRRKIMTDWIEPFLSDSDSRGKRLNIFPRYCFFDHSNWACHALAQVCAYFNPALRDREHKPLADALKYVFLNYFMTHDLAVVPKNARKLLDDFIRDPMYRQNQSLRFKECVPLATERCVKSFMVNAVKQYAKSALNELDRMMSARRRTTCSNGTSGGFSGNINWETDVAFCVAFLVLHVLGRNQIFVLNRAHIPADDRPWGREEALQMIREMEDEFAEVVGAFAGYRFGTDARKEKDSDQQRSGSRAITAAGPVSPTEIEAQQWAQKRKLFAELAEIADEYAFELYEVTGLDPSDPEKFAITNTQRLLATLYTTNFRKTGKT